MNFIKIKSKGFLRYYLTQCQNYLIKERENSSKEINRFNNQKRWSNHKSKIIDREERL